jgi:hypothetical protein
MPFEWACGRCGWPNEPDSSVCVHCETQRLKDPDPASDPNGAGMSRRRKAVLAFLSVEAWTLVLYMIGIQATIAGMNLATFSLLVAVAAAVVTYLVSSEPRRTIETVEPQPLEDRSVSEDVGVALPAGPPVEESTPAPPRRWRRRLLVLGLAVVIVGFVGYVGLSFLGGQVQKVLAGQIQFGTTAPNGCDIAQSATEFPAGTTLYWAAYLRNEAPAGTTLVIEESRGGHVVGTTDYVTSVTATCLATTSATPALAAGIYTVRILRGSTEEATGTIAVR